MKKRIFCMLMTAVMALSVCAAAVPVRAQGQGTVPELCIVAQNVSFQDSVYLKYAVSFENAEADDVTLLIWTQPQSDYSVQSGATALTAAGSAAVGGKEECLIFEYKDLAAKQMTDEIYARAYTEKNGISYYSAVKKYSILQYCYNMLGKTGTASSSESLKNLLEQMLSYGAAAQTHFAYKADALATADFYQVNVQGGALADGCNSGLYVSGSVLTVTAPTTDENGNTFTHWENSAGVSVGTAAELSYTVGTKNETLTAVYGTGETYTVTFKNWDGTVLKTQTVSEGENGTPPADPSREGYTFSGWSGSYTNVTENITVTATYTENVNGPHLVCENASVERGATTVLCVKLADCDTPIDALAISVSENSGDFTFTKGSWSSDYDYEISNFNKTKSQGVARLTDSETVDGDIFSLTVKAPADLEAGTYTLLISLKITYFDSNEDELEIICHPVEVSITVN